MLFLGHGAAVKDELTVLENLEFSSRISCLEISESKIKSALDCLGIPRLADLPARYLSQGQRKRAALARLALSPGVALWLLDEPFAAPDDEAILRGRALCAPPRPGRTGNRRPALPPARPAPRARGAGHRPAIRPSGGRARRAACVAAH